MASRQSTNTSNKLARLNLRDTVCAFVNVEQARGLPLSAVIVSVKDILAKAQNGVRRASDELAKQLIDWCVEFHLSRQPVSAPPVS